MSRCFSVLLAALALAQEPARFQVSPLPELPRPTAPPAGVWTQPRAEMPPEMTRPEGIDQGSVSVDDWRRFDEAARFDRGDAPPEKKAARWRDLARQVRPFAPAAEERAARWDDYAAQNALDDALEQESGPAPAQEKAAVWARLAERWPRYAPTARAQAGQWSRYAGELSGVEQVWRQRAQIRERDWPRLRKLLALPSVSESEKRASAAAFVEAYGKAAEGDPHAPELLRWLPARLLSPQEAASVAGIEWVTIPGGTFLMGSEDLGPSALPRHRVSVPAFRLAKTLVTDRQYQACVAAGACRPVGDCARPAQETAPATCVDWDQAQAFARWVGGRLPTEAEWEFAARSRGRGQSYPWGDEEPSCKLAVFDDARWPQPGRPGCGRRGPWPVCSKPKGDTEQGLCDMAGNAWQWTQDWYHDTYDGAPADSSAWEAPAGAERVIRGGAWPYSAALLRSAGRCSAAPGKRGSDVGLRPAQSLP